jgi:murein L,D-transpeptidase YcbB/YkuD
MRYFTLLISAVFFVSLFAVGQVGAQQQTGQQQQRQQPGQTGEQQQQPGQMGQQQQQRQAGQEISADQLTSQQIQELQQALQEQGNDPGPIDGIMGPLTQQALREFQQDEGLAATGQLNEETLEALDLDVQEFMGVAPGFEEERARDQQREDQQQRQPLQERQEERQQQQ